MDKVDFIKIINNLENFFNQELNVKAKKEWYEALKNISKEDCEQAIKQIYKNNKFMPKLSELLQVLNNKQEYIENNINNTNLNSSYWYINLRQWCEENNKPYFDIYTGKELAPFKN